MNNSEPHKQHQYQTKTTSKKPLSDNDSSESFFVDIYVVFDIQPYVEKTVNNDIENHQSNVDKELNIEETNHIPYLEPFYLET